MKTAFIINPKSGRPKFLLHLQFIIKKYFGNDGNVRILKTQYHDHARELAAQAVQDGVELVVAVGGDGTVNQVASSLVGTPSTLGVVPTGSGNGFARNMGLPMQLEKSITSLRDHRARTIDVGKVNDEHFFLVSCGIGWEAVIASLFEGSKLRGMWTYAGVTINTFLQYEPQEVRIMSNPGDWFYQGRPMLLSVANMREYGLGISIAPEADYRDGFLDICLIPRHTMLSAIKYMPEMLRQNTDVIPGYLRHPAQNILISRPIAGNIHIDGTPIPAGNEVKVSVIPEALKVAIKADRNP